MAASGAGYIEKVEVTDGIGTWVEAALGAKSRFGATHWRAELQLEPGRYNVGVKATDMVGNTQPLEAVQNKGGYGNNMVHTIPVDCRD